MSCSLVCGLGNPGRDYTHTRHNLGFMVLDRLVAVLEAEMHLGKGEYLVSESTYLGRSVYLVKPLTYVNGSGIAVSEATARFGAELEDLLIVCDDCELPFGKIRLRGKGQHGGHHGLESIIYQLESEEFARLRIGIGRPPSVDLTEYVLSEFEPEEKEELPRVTEEAEQAVMLYLDKGLEEAMTLVNRRTEVE